MAIHNPIDINGIVLDLKNTRYRFSAYSLWYLLAQWGLREERCRWSIEMGINLLEWIALIYHNLKRGDKLGEHTEWSFACAVTVSFLFVLLVTARWHRKMPSGGDVIWGKKRLAIYKMYGTITKPWRGENLVLLKERKLPDPYFWPMLDLGGRLTEERKYVLALLAVYKFGSKKHRWN